MYKDESIFQNGGPHGKYHKLAKTNTGSYAGGRSLGECECCCGTAE